MPQCFLCWVRSMQSLPVGRLTVPGVGQESTAVPLPGQTVACCQEEAVPGWLRPGQVKNQTRLFPDLGPPALSVVVF